MRKFSRHLITAAALLWLISCGESANESVPSMGDLKSDNVLLRMLAIEAAAKGRDSSAVPDLIELLDSSFEEVRVKSVYALGTIGSEEAVPALIERLDDESLEVRREVVTALGKLKDPQAMSPLIRLLVDDDLELAVIWALGNIGDKSAVPILNRLMASEDPYVKYNASRALAKMQ